VPGINIPIYTLQLKDFSFPITLSYHAGGIKVEEMASNIGLGWSLIADGEISRTVKRQPDEFGWYANHGTTEPQPLTIRPPVQPLSGGTIVYGTISGDVEGAKDTEPDVFYFSVN